MKMKHAMPVDEKADNSSVEEGVRRELSRVVSSKAFRPVDRLQRFLSFVVEETLAGRGDRLKEYPIGVDVFEKDSSFDPRMDPIVRVQARRLRMRLDSYYLEEGQSDEIVIELPKGGYAPVFRQAESVPLRKQKTPALVSRNTVAVLPFVSHSSSIEAKYFAQGMFDEIVHALSQLGSILVVSGRGGAGDDTLRDESGAAMIVTGSVRASKETFRITTGLIDTIRGCYVWSHSVDRAIGDAFAVQEEIARAVVDALRSELIEGDGLRSRHHKLENLAAHNLYLQGRYHLDQRTEKGLRKAVDFFEKTLAEDPKFAPAYAGMADAHVLLGHYGASAPSEVWTKVAANATQAVLVDDESSEAHVSLGHVKSTQDWDWSGAEQEFRRAIALNPRNSTAHHWYAMSCLAPLGRLDEALEELLLAQSLDPVSSIISRDIALIHYYKRDFDLALDQCDHTIEQNPHFFAAYWTLGLVQEQRGDLDEAAAAFRRAIELSPPSPRILGALGRTYAIGKKREDALEILQELDELAMRRYISPFELALIYFALKRMDEGFEFLKKAYQDRCFELISIKVDPRFDSVRKDSRFSVLLDRLQLP